MKSFALFLFGLAAAAIVIGCKNPSSGTGTDTTPYTVTYNLNGGTGTVPTDANTYTVGQDVTAAAAPTGLSPPAVDKKFAGWNTKADGSGTDAAVGGTIAMPSEDMTLYAKWVDAYTVTYNLNGGTGATAPTDSDRYASGDSVTAAAAPAGLTAPADKRFAGWNTENDGSGTDAAAGGTITMPSEDMTLYAKWVDITYTVTYNLNGGTGATAPIDTNTYTAGQVVTAAVAPTGLVPPTGKTFDGWNTEADGSGTDVTAGGTGTIAMPSGGGLILYAKWSN